MHERGRTNIFQAICAARLMERQARGIHKPGHSEVFGKRKMGRGLVPSFEAAAADGPQHAVLDGRPNLRLQYDQAKRSQPAQLDSDTDSSDAAEDSIVIRTRPSRLAIQPQPPRKTRRSPILPVAHDQTKWPPA